MATKTKRGRRPGTSPTALACPSCGGPTVVSWAIGRERGRADGALIEVRPGVRGVRRYRRCTRCSETVVAVEVVEADLEDWLLRGRLGGLRARA